jgi:glycosyl-4,4'-diaponeurosporenoate acyltransferase
MRVVVMPDIATVVVDVIAWGIVHAGSGYAVHRLPVSSFERERWWSKSRAFECNGHWYERTLRIKRWKDRLPEAGGLFRGGVSKRTLPDAQVGGLGRFVVETRRAELGHLIAACAGPFFVLWNPPVAAALMVLYGVAVNLPFIAIQRYNRLRAMRVLRRRDARIDRSSPSTSALGRERKN